MRIKYLLGKIVIPEYRDEEKQIVDGVHEAIINEGLFIQTQHILSQVLKRREAMVASITIITVKMAAKSELEHLKLMIYL